MQASLPGKNTSSLDFHLLPLETPQNHPCTIINISGNSRVPKTKIQSIVTPSASKFHQEAFLSLLFSTIQFSSAQSLSCVRLLATPWTVARQASQVITNSWSLLKLMSIKSVTPSNHLILCHPLLLPPSIFPSIRVFSNELPLRIRWPKY